MRNRWIRPQDCFLVLLCLLAAGGLFLWQYTSPSEGIALIEQDGKEIGRYPLSQVKEEKIITLSGEYNVQIRLEPGAVSFLSSDCPDQTCVRTGKLTKAGQASVCLPARISIRILSSSGDSPAYDGITG